MDTRNDNVQIQFYIVVLFYWFVVVFVEGVSKVRITVLKRFKPSEVFKKMPVTSKNKNFAECTMFKDKQTLIVEGSGIGS